MKDEIKACPICGSTNLIWVGGGLERLGISTTSGKSRCGNCNNIILPILFSKENYKKFLKHLKNQNKK